MFRNTQALAVFVYLVVAMVDGHRSPSNHSPQRRYGINPWEQRYWRLNSQIKSCEHGYVCDVKTGPNGCEPVCISRQQLCDGHSDCANAEDEAGCIEITECQESEFTCMINNVKTCLPASEWCNGNPVCDNNSDEQDCQCKESEFTCMINNVKTCQPMSERCNGSPVCDNNSDEQDCQTICSANQVRCSLNETICANLCDGNPECPADSLGYVLDEPMPNCGCQINTSAPFHCVATSSLNLFTGAFSGTYSSSDFPFAVLSCRILPECTGIIDFLVGNMVLGKVDLIALEDEPCLETPTGPFITHFALYPCISQP